VKFKKIEDFRVFFLAAGSNRGMKSTKEEGQKESSKGKVKKRQSVFGWSERFFILRSDSDEGSASGEVRSPK
jgi:hypothetical protein